MRGVRNSQFWIILLILFTFFIRPANAKYGGGTGEPNDPYLIYTPEHLNTIVTAPNDWDKYFKLMSDIDLSGLTYSTAVIPRFTGIFEGNNFTISNLIISCLDCDNAGFIGTIQLGGNVQNLSIVDVNISGSGNRIGAIAGTNLGEVINCNSTGIVNVTGDSIGGLVGYNNEGIITGCFSSGQVKGSNAVGGLIGNNLQGNVNNCYSTATVNGKNYIGGFIGANEYGLLTDSYSAGKVSGDVYTGGFLGWNSSPVRNVIACFWDKDISGQISSNGGTGKTTAEMQTTNTFLETGWIIEADADNSSDDLWWINEGQDYPRLLWELNEEAYDYTESTLLAENDMASVELASADDSSEYLTEQFSSSSDMFDLSYKSIMFTPTTDGSSYSAVLREITSLPTDPAGSTNLDLGDDGYILVNLSDLKRVYIYGFSYIRFYVGSNGYLTFTRGDTNNYDLFINHFNTKRVSCLFQDLDPSQDGMVRWKQTSDRIAVTWENVPEYVSNGPNTFQVEMFFDGRIQLSWLEISTKYCIVGLSPGTGLPENFEETDFSELASSSTPTPGNTPELPSGRKNRKK